METAVGVREGTALFYRDANWKKGFWGSTLERDNRLAVGTLSPSGVPVPIVDLARLFFRLLFPFASFGFFFFFFFFFLSFLKKLGCFLDFEFF